MLHLAYANVKWTKDPPRGVWSSLQVDAEQPTLADWFSNGCDPRVAPRAFNRDAVVHGREANPASRLRVGVKAEPGSMPP